MNNRQNGRRRGRGGQQARNGQPGIPERGSRLDNRARGNAAQLLEKYKSLARDAQMQGDRVSTEYYLQFADHYFRVLSEARGRFDEQRPEQNRRRDEYRDEFGQEGARDDMGDDEASDDRPRGYENGGNWDEQGDGGEVEMAEPQQQPQRSAPPRRDVPETNGRAMTGDEGERYQERRPRRRRSAPETAAPSAMPPSSDGDNDPRAAERIEVDRLPQGLGTVAAVVAEPAAEEVVERPRRRAPRRPRAEAPVAEA